MIAAYDGFTALLLTVPPHAQTGAFACPETRDAQLVLDPAVVAPLARSPWSIRVLPVDTFLAIATFRESETAFTLAHIDRRGTERPIRPVPGPSWVSLGSSRIILRSQSAIQDLAQGDDGPALVELNQDPTEVILDAALHDASLWYLVESQGGVRLRHRSVGSTVVDRDVDHEWEIDVSGALTIVGERRVVLTALRPPHQLLLFHLGQTEPTVLVPTISVTADSIAVLGAIGTVVLDCGFVLVTVADLRSYRRWLVLVDVQNPRITRVTSLDEPLGLFQSDPSRREVYVYSDHPERRAVMAWKWSWRVSPTR